MNSREEYLGRDTIYICTPARAFFVDLGIHGSSAGSSGCNCTSRPKASAITSARTGTRPQKIPKCMEHASGRSCRYSCIHSLTRIVSSTASFRINNTFWGNVLCNFFILPYMFLCFFFYDVRRIVYDFPLVFFFLMCYVELYVLFMLS